MKGAETMMLVDEGLEILSEQECWQLLGEATVGRVGLSVHALPVILPVNYAVVDESLVFWSTTGMKLDAARSHTVVAFEVDRVDGYRRRGWSVLVVGTATVVRDPDLVDRVHQTGLRPWVYGDRPFLVRVSVDFISGRRIAPCED